MKAIRCLFCGKTTSLQRKSIRKKVRDKMITLDNAPIFFCEHCNETFYAAETLQTFSYIKNMGLESKNILFEFNTLFPRVSKT